MSQANVISSAANVTWYTDKCEITAKDGAVTYQVYATSINAATPVGNIWSNAVSVGANTVQLKTLESQEKMTRERLEYLMKRAGDPATASRKIDKQIQETQVELTQITKDKLPLMTEENKLMADVGPIRYVAELLYDKNDAQFIDKAVRVVIFIIIFVFDPLAVLLLIAANMTLKNLQSEKTPDIIVNKTKKKKTETKPTNTIENFFVDENSEVIPKTQITNMTGDFK